ncbi:MAG TPA: Omp28-related outer membrane protein [Flavobacteriales bacterium]|nr:Omp28-related outer membrane protein [Flavobacteriales bacterium]
MNSGTISVAVKVKLLEELDPVEYSLTVYLQESGIVDYQTDQNASPPDVPDYMHNHVLRGALNGSWGQPFAVADLAVGDSVTVELTSLAIPSNVLNISNCELVAYLYRNDTYEILQVHAHHVE